MIIVKAVINTLILYILSLCAAMSLELYIEKRQRTWIRNCFILTGIIFPILVALNFIIHG